jgi:putative tryptophan/tyrosine transport system substrate-binding protein
MQRRAFLQIAGGALASAWPAQPWAQQPSLPVIAYVNGGEPGPAAPYIAAFRKGLSEAGVVEGRSVSVEFTWFRGDYRRVPDVMADLVRRRVAVIATPGFPPGALAAKAATAASAIPVVFGVGEDPVKLGLVTSVSHPGGNVTGINFFVQEAVTKRLALLRELVPKISRLAILVNPGHESSAATTVKDVNEVAPKLGLQIFTYNASTPAEIDAAFVAFKGDQADALLVAGDGFLNSRRSQIATLAARDKLPIASAGRESAEAGGLMAYGASIPDMYRQVGVYAASIVKGARPSDLPVLQSTKFEFVINLQTARALGIEVPPTLLARADEVIE